MEIKNDNIKKYQFLDLALENNLASNTKWLVHIPLENLFRHTYKNLVLNINSIQLPDLNVSTYQVRYFGKTVELPTKVLTPESQTVRFEYMLSSNYFQYMALMMWLQVLTLEMQHDNTNIPVDLIKKDLDDYRLPISLFLLSEFKVPICKFTFDKSWIKEIEPINFDYKNASDDPIIGSFVIGFLKLKFEIMTDAFALDSRKSNYNKPID